MAGRHVCFKPSLSLQSLLLPLHPLTHPPVTFLTPRRLTLHPTTPVPPFLSFQLHMCPLSLPLPRRHSSCPFTLPLPPVTLLTLLRVLLLLPLHSTFSRSLLSLHPLSLRSFLPTPSLPLLPVTMFSLTLPLPCLGPHRISIWQSTLFSLSISIVKAFVSRLFIGIYNVRAIS